jgi:hypothetical protein
MTPYILMVTWLILGQPPQSYQVKFLSEEACVAARDAVLADGRRVRAEYDRIQIDAAKASEVDPSLFMASKQSPDVSAVCAATGVVAFRHGAAVYARRRPLRTASVGALWWQKLFPRSRHSGDPRK